MLVLRELGIDVLRALDGVKDARMIERLLRAYAAAYPGLTRLIELGRSPKGRPLLALRIAVDPGDAARPSILLNAAHHPREVVTPEYVLDTIGRLLEDRTAQTREWLASLAVVAVPMVNPDGSHAFWHVSGLFGRIALHLKFITPDQLRQAVEIHGRYGNTRRMAVRYGTSDRMDW